MEMAAEMVARLQPNARSSGTISTRGRGTHAGRASITRNITAEDDPGIVQPAGEQLGEAGRGHGGPCV